MFTIEPNGANVHVVRFEAPGAGWEYSDEMLYEPAVSTELAACYLDKLFERYGDARLVLAEYNGGPKNARRLISMLIERGMM